MPLLWWEVLTCTVLRGTCADIGNVVVTKDKRVLQWSRLLSCITRTKPYE